MAYSFTFNTIGCFFVLLFFIGCQKNKKKDALPFDVEIPLGFPPLPQNPSNPLTEEGINLGKKLFYDRILSGSNSQNCASCHNPKAAFSDPGLTVSEGENGSLGTRNSMSLFNLAYADRFFWDGRVNSLEEQVIIPITAEFEMNQDPKKLIDELQNHPKYPQLFQKAFHEEEITILQVQMALAQFLRTLFSTSDNLKAGHQENMSEAARRGLMVFLNEEKGDCFNCHTISPFNTTFKFINNGLNKDPSKDPGLGAITKKEADMGKFKIPSLLNIALTAPYMHDGRFETLEEVIDFYDTGFHVSKTLDPILLKHTNANKKPIPRKWTQQDKADLKEFLLSLTDTTYITNPKYRLNVNKKKHNNEL